jgi:hypothetical protein
VPKLKQLKQDGTPNIGDVVTYDGTSWVPATPTSGNALTGNYTHAGGLNFGDAVYSPAPGIAAIADADGPTTQPLIGIVLSVLPPFPAPGAAVIQYQGEISGFVAAGIPLVPNVDYFLTTAGVTGLTISNVPPAAGTGPILQRVGLSKDPDTLIIMVDRDFIQLP